jgi:chemotaxis protein CheX
VKLAPVLDLSAAKPLWAELGEARGQPLEIDASGVERLGGLCLQVLLSAQVQWRADGAAFSIANPSSAFADAVKLMTAHDLAPREEPQ